MHRPAYMAIAAAVIASAASAAGCRMPVGIDRKPGTAPRCENGVCVEVVSFISHRSTIGVWIDAPPATRLVNARVTADDGPACQGPYPVEWVDLDGQLHRTGPVDVGGAHGLVLGFPINTWLSHSGYWRAVFVDVELDVAGATRCIRTRLTDAAGKEAVGS